MIDRQNPKRILQLFFFLIFSYFSFHWNFVQMERAGQIFGFLISCIVYFGRFILETESRLSGDLYSLSCKMSIEKHKIYSWKIYHPRFFPALLNEIVFFPSYSQRPGVISLFLSCHLKGHIEKVFHLFFLLKKMGFYFLMEFRVGHLMTLKVIEIIKIIYRI